MNALRERKMSEIQLPEAFQKLGEVLEQGGAEEIFEHPRHPRLRQFFQTLEH